MHSALLTLHLIHSSLAQSVEHLTVNQGVVGSSPTGGAKTKSPRQSPRVFCFAFFPAAPERSTLRAEGAEGGRISLEILPTRAARLEVCRMVRYPKTCKHVRGSHIGATILHHITKVLDFQGLFVFLGVKNNPISPLHPFSDLMDLNLLLYEDALKK